MRGPLQRTVNVMEQEILLEEKRERIASRYDIHILFKKR